MQANDSLKNEFLSDFGTKINFRSLSKILFYSFNQSCYILEFFIDSSEDIIASFKLSIQKSFQWKPKFQAEDLKTLGF